MQQEIDRGTGPYFYMGGTAQLGEEQLNTKIEGKGGQVLRISFDFPFSGERLTLKLSPKRSA